MTLENNLQAVKNGIHKEDIKADIKKIGSHVRSDVSELAGDLKEYAASKADHTAEELRDRYYDLKQKGKSELQYLEQKVAERPLRSIAIAAGVGAVLSMLLGRR